MKTLNKALWKAELELLIERYLNDDDIRYEDEYEHWKRLDVINEFFKMLKKGESLKKLKDFYDYHEDSLDFVFHNWVDEYDHRFFDYLLMSQDVKIIKKIMKICNAKKYFLACGGTEDTRMTVGYLIDMLKNVKSISFFKLVFEKLLKNKRISKDMFYSDLTNKQTLFEIKRIIKDGGLYDVL